MVLFYAVREEGGADKAFRAKKTPTNKTHVDFNLK